jgi:hypothetical protein
MDLDPALALAFTLRANPGAYAFLLGSGVSKGVVPSGWEVLVDLVSKVAAAAGVSDEDPLRWYERTLGQTVGYDSVLAALTSTPEERVGLLRPYFEPSSDDEDADAKRPTLAHQAIARLMKVGLVRVVLTRYTPYDLAAITLFTWPQRRSPNAGSALLGHSRSTPGA